MISEIHLKKSNWHPILVFTLAFWLSGSLVLDLLMMPTLYASGMMASPGFAAAGYSMFWAFNRVELLCAALVLTGSLALYWTRGFGNRLQSTTIVLAGFLLTVALIFTYGLTPQMSALGLQLDAFTSSVETPALMNVLHAGYWALELLKLTAGGGLLWLVYRASSMLDA